VAVDTDHHLIIAHEVTNSGSDRAQLANMARQAKAVLKTETLEAVADRGYFSSPGIIQTKKPTRCCGATGPTPVRIVRSNPSARPGQSDGSHDGSTRICSTPYSSGSMRTRSLCAFVARLSSIRSAR